jgi:hypothetical protein
MATHSSYMNHEDIANSTVGVMFFGTPHCGSDASKYGEALVSIVSIFKTPNKKIVDVLKKDSALLRRTQLDFANWERKRDKNGKAVRIANFFEEKPMTIAGKVGHGYSAVQSCSWTAFTKQYTVCHGGSRGFRHNAGVVECSYQRESY